MVCDRKHGEAIILSTKGSYPTRIGALINLLAQIIKSSKEGKLIIRYIREIYNDRKSVDHGILIATEERCRKNIIKGEYVISYLEQRFRIKLMKNN